jgi:hypothetical protein
LKLRFHICSIKQNKAMKISEIEKWLEGEGEDKAIVGVNNEASAKYVDMLLKEQRPVNSEKAKKIIADCERLAKFYKRKSEQKTKLLAA